ncbi:MAG TPA: nicotinate-nucleotide adenylyltransferase [Rhodocyclaceae bacterium]|nr:nicotinate-nucleotide adenylyltransferase [Rhodocyclaceae bacterium]HMZ01263.1 nicotinate-nucleotide adenylyltransferase [Burkholderiaceae bacterium]HNE17667.1 nicotinate-nucleotide adenylyltransferase [Rhodocyclaceae bacterium]
MRPTETGPLGLFGGTFDPIHSGHLRLAEEAREQLGLAAVRLIPAGQPPHRDVPGAPAADRLAMARLAVADNPAFEVDPAEVLAAQPSYTILTLERVRAEVGPERPLVLLLGVDAFLGLPTWKRWRELFDFAHLAVANRPGYTLDPARMTPELAAACAHREAATVPASPAGALVQFRMTPLAISATDIRQRRAAGRSLRYLLPAPVLDYISAHQLYL